MNKQEKIFVLQNLTNEQKDDAIFWAKFYESHDLTFQEILDNCSKRLNDVYNTLKYYTRNSIISIMYLVAEHDAQIVENDGTFDPIRVLSKYMSYTNQTAQRTVDRVNAREERQPKEPSIIEKMKKTAATAKKKKTKVEVEEKQKEVEQISFLDSDKTTNI